MAADPTLVKGAFAVGQSMIGPDLSKYYEAKYTVDMGLIKGITDIFTANQKESEAMMAQLEEPMEKLLTDIAAGGNPGSERLYDKTVIEMDKLKEQYKSALKSKDKKTQHKVLGRLNRMISQRDKTGTNLLTVGKLVLAGEINASATPDGAANFAALKQIIDFDNGNPGVTYEYDDNGYLSYRVQTEEHGEVVVKASEIDKMAIPHAKGKEAAFNDMRSEMMLSYSKGGLWNFDEAKYDIASNIINTRQEFADLANRKWGNMEVSYKQALLTNKELWGALRGMGDWDQDGDVDKDDYVTQDNIVTVVDALTNINAKDENGNSTFDWALAKDQFAGFLAKELESKYNTGKKAAINKNKLITTKGKYEGGIETIGGIKYGFENEDTTQKQQDHRLVARAVLKKNKEVYSPDGGWFDLIEKDGKEIYQSRIEKTDDEGDGTGEYDTWTPDQFLKQFATTQIPIIIGGGGKDLNVIEYKPEGDLALTKPSAKEYVEGQKDELGQKITPPPNQVENLVWDSRTKSWITVFQYGGI